MSGNIRKQLGPARKRLSDRMKEVDVLMDEGVLPKLKTIRVKLISNIEYHERLTKELRDLTDLDDAEQTIVDAEIEKATVLDMDAKESCAVLTEYISENGEDKRKELSVVTYEIEKLKVETDYKRKKMEKLDAETKGTVNQQKIKLPTVALQKFCGIFTEWPSFWDYFDATIKKKECISTVDKFKYLLSSLEGEAKETLTGFKITEAQYTEAINHLKERYENTEYIIHQYYSALSTLPKSSCDILSLRKTYNFIETQIRSLSSMGENVESKHLVAIIKSKLPDELNIKLEESKTGDWTVSVLRKAIEKFIVARERSCQFKSSVKQSFRFDNDVQESIQNYDMSGEGLLSKEVKIKCVFCEGTHWSDECQKFKSLEHRKLQIRGRCFICLSEKHYFRDCKSDKPCFYCKRRRNYNSALCPDKFGDGFSGKRRNEGGNGKSTEEELVEFGDEVAFNITNDVIMKTARTTLRNKETGDEERANVLLDTGAKRTYITMEMAKKLNLRLGPQTVVRVNAFGTGNTNDIRINMTSLVIKMKDGCNKIIQAKICNTITGSMAKQKINVEKYKHISKDLEMADENFSEKRKFDIDILIGNDYYDDIVKSEKIEVDQGLYLVNSTLGWMFSGRVKGNKGFGIDGQDMFFLVEDDDDQLKKFWEIDAIGIQTKTEEIENNEILELVHKDLKIIDNRYQVGWPWKTSRYELPDNYNLAEARLKSLVNKFQKDRKSMVKYDGIIKKQAQDEMIEVADNRREYLDSDNVVVHYIPHHMVKSGDDENSKLRIVFEGCAKTHKGKLSINDCLHKGRNMVKNLVGVLLRFRLKRVALAADIEKAYLQLELKPEDRDVTRFIWVRDIDKPFSKDNIIEYRFCRVIWGIISAAFLLACVITLHLLNYNSDTSKDVENNLYVDNLITGTNSTKEAIDYYIETKKIFREASMNMRDWASNDEEFMKHVDDADVCRNNIVKVLGMIWRTDEDVMSLSKMNEPHETTVITKRKMLKRIASVYDPIGFVVPVVIRFKIIMQEVWKQKIDWDEEVPKELIKKWNYIKGDLMILDTIKIRRYMQPNQNGRCTYELITFSDASSKAYAAAVYLRIVSGDSVNVYLVYAKSRLAPINEVSIPRLELLGVVIGCRASQFVADQLGIGDVKQYLLTDAACVLEWYKSKKILKRFVKDKIEEIRKCDISIGYVEGECNPADVATRGESVKDLQIDNLWWNGPVWLSNPDFDFSENTYSITDTLNKVVESEEKVQVLHEISLVAAKEKVVSSPLDINMESISGYSKLLRITSWCLRFIHNLREIIEPWQGVLTVEELNAAEEMWIKYSQQKNFPDVFKAINCNKRNQLVSNLGVKIDERGILRCVGRFQDITGAPKLLPKDDAVTRKVITKVHRELLHTGLSQTLSCIRENYWIIQGRSAVKKIIKMWLVCKFWDGGEFKTPMFAPLPDYSKSANITPYTFVGIDYLGPVKVKYVEESIKAWICLFTCVNVRAVHLELVENATCAEFLMCMRRFIAKRGKPGMIICDNAGQFTLGNAVMDKIWKNVISDPEAENYIANKRIRWKYITEYSPWKGGFYERMVGLTKSSLKKSLGKRLVTSTQLRTLLCEIEAVINTRPLMYLDDDVNSKRAITSADFIGSGRRCGIPDITLDYEPKETPVQEVIKNWKKGQESLDEFWKRWSTEYLQGLRSRHSLQMKSVKGEIERTPMVGEVVIIEEEYIPRGRWKLGRIKETLKSDMDGVVRAAQIVTSSGKLIKRPLRMLYPLEYDFNDIDDRKESNKNHMVDEELNVKNLEKDFRKIKIRRKAAIEAEKKMKL